MVAINFEKLSIEKLIKFCARSNRHWISLWFDSKEIEGFPGSLSDVWFDFPVPRPIRSICGGPISLSFQAYERLAASCIDPKPATVWRRELGDRQVGLTYFPAGSHPVGSAEPNTSKYKFQSARFSGQIRTAVFFDSVGTVLDRHLMADPTIRVEEARTALSDWPSSLVGRPELVDEFPWSDAEFLDQIDSRDEWYEHSGQGAEYRPTIRDAIAQLIDEAFGDQISDEDQREVLEREAWKKYERARKKR